MIIKEIGQIIEIKTIRKVIWETDTGIFQDRCFLSIENDEKKWNIEFRGKYEKNRDILVEYIKMYLDGRKKAEDFKVTTCEVCGKEIVYNEYGTCEECHKKIMERLEEKIKPNV